MVFPLTFSHMRSLVISQALVVFEELRTRLALKVRRFWVIVAHTLMTSQNVIILVDFSTVLTRFASIYMGPSVLLDAGFAQNF